MYEMNNCIIDYVFKYNFSSLKRWKTEASSAPAQAYGTKIQLIPTFSTQPSFGYLVVRHPARGAQHSYRLTPLPQNSSEEEQLLWDIYLKLNKWISLMFID